jgi:hypothetical protein
MQQLATSDILHEIEVMVDICRTKPPIYMASELAKSSRNIYRNMDSLCLLFREERNKTRYAIDGSTEDQFSYTHKWEM